MSEPPLPRKVSRAFEAFPPPVRRRLLDVRRLIFATAKAHDDVGPLTETLKWGEPSYLTERSGSGSTIRLGRVKDSETHAAVVETFRERFPDQFEYRQNRALQLPVTGTLAKQPLAVCLSLALTYHLDHRGRR
ncbi:DUF1801 domain-containing protein [Bradyrhizobium sp. CB82]|uniref:DUF1801 domain-containing protein n=1 Tax=Bradyrhizobium sp. CB82 TaxID=3039159 RepID=UPI0024B0587B|nr:DUF1801 domain-containing protein [Bradyrhizobium sp. CB82]WFU41929.1 DUF1801 domain-containing protein [Bradyrhizobium sp. CB82]